MLSSWDPENVAEKARCIPVVGAEPEGEVDAVVVVGGVAVGGGVVGAEVVGGVVVSDASATSLGVRYGVTTFGTDVARTRDRRRRNSAKVMNDEGSQDFVASDTRTFKWTLLLTTDERFRETTVM